jgi:hypothetical protein
MSPYVVQNLSGTANALPSEGVGAVGDVQDTTDSQLQSRLSCVAESHVLSSGMTV